MLLPRELQKLHVFICLIPTVPSAGGKQAASLRAPGVCQPKVGKRASAAGLHISPQNPADVQLLCLFYGAQSSLKLRSPAGGQNILLTLASALNSVYGSKCLRERKHYTRLRCSPAPAASAANSSSWPCLKVAQVFSPPPCKSL